MKSFACRDAWASRRSCTEVAHPTRRLERGAAAAALLFCAACTLPSLTANPRPDANASAPLRSIPAEPALVAVASIDDALVAVPKKETAPPARMAQRILWRGEPLEVDLIATGFGSESGGSAGSPTNAEDGKRDADDAGRSWVLSDLVLESADGGVAIAVLRANGNVRRVPLEAMRLAAPRAESAALRGAELRTRTAAWMAPNAQEPAPGGQGIGDENGANLPDRHSPLFAERASERLEGELQDPEQVDDEGRAVIVTLRSANNHYHRVLLAPSAFLTARNVTLTAGAKVAIDGVRTRDGRGALWAARSLVMDGKTVMLRRETGIPRWTPAPAPDETPEEAPAEIESDAPSEPTPAEEVPTEPAPTPVEAPVVAPTRPPLADEGGRLSALALLMTNLELEVGLGGAPEPLAVSGIVLDLAVGSVPYLALRPRGDIEESWLWVPWEALTWRNGNAYLELPKSAALPPPSGPVEAGTLLPGDAVLRRAREYWLAGRGG